VLYAQTIQRPWSVVDGGGGKVTAGGITLRSSIGQPAIQAGTADSVTGEPGYIPGLRQLNGAFAAFELEADSAWNLISVPLIVTSYLKTDLYPSAISVAYGYTGTYKQRDTLQLLNGYWIKYPHPTALSFSGTAMVIETTQVNNYWNMVGCISYPVVTSGIAALGTSVTSSFFGFNNVSGYSPVDTLKPGYGYWVKTSGPGQLVMSPGPVIVPEVSSSLVMQTKRERNQPEKFSTLTVRDAQGSERTLSFTTVPTKPDVNRLDLPPAPPSFDVRYASNRMAEFADEGRVKDVALRITSASYPLSITWKSHDEATLLIDGKATSLKGAGNVVITNPDSPIKLRLIPSGGVELPKDFAVHQNYPNPFNPVTTIRYDLPTAAKVSLKVYNVLGQEVVTLVDEVQDAGYKTVKWDGSAIASGLYYYRIVAGNFTDVRKMMLVK